MKAGFFTMDTVHEVMKQKTLGEAQAIAYKAIEDMPSAKPENKAKAKAMVDRAKTVNQLGMALTNFLLAHPSEGLKCI